MQQTNINNGVSNSYGHNKNTSPNTVSVYCGGYGVSHGFNPGCSETIRKVGLENRVKLLEDEIGRLKAEISNLKDTIYGDKREGSGITIGTTISMSDRCSYS